MTEDNEGHNNHIKGIGGWLWLVAIGVTLSPLINLAADITTFSELLNEDTWSQLTDNNSIYYTPFFAVLIYFEIGYAIIIDGLLFYLVYLFYGKNSTFPPLYIKLVFAVLILSLVDIFFASLVFPELTVGELFDTETLKGIFQTLIAICIWVPYMKKSIRVKNTFVN